MQAVGGGGFTGVPGLAIEAGVEVVVGSGAVNHGGIEDVDRVPVAGG